MTPSFLLAAARFVRILRTNSECDSAPRGELRGYDRLAWRTRFHEIVQNAVRYRFVEGTLIPIRREIKLKRLAFDAQTIRDVIDVYPAKIRLAGDWTNRSEIIRFEMYPIIPTRGGIWKSLEARLGR